MGKEMKNMPKDESFSEKVLKEMGFNFSMSDRKPIVYFAFWIDKRDDGSISPTICKMEDEPLSKELKEQTVAVLRRLADSIERG